MVFLSADRGTAKSVPDHALIWKYPEFNDDDIDALRSALDLKVPLCFPSTSLFASDCRYLLI